MGLASKIKNSTPATAASPAQQPPPSYEGGYDYPPVQHDGRYGGAPAPDYPQHQHGAPSAPPFPKQTEQQQYYGAGYATPYQQPHVESTPSAPSLYAEQGQTPPYAGQGSPYGERVQSPSSTYGMFSPDAGAQPSYMQQPGAGGFRPAQYQQASHPMAINTDMLAQKLQGIIQANRLQSFYDQGRFQAVLQKVAAINFAEIAAQWNLSKELAYDLAPLVLYDIVFYCDDSGSMAFEENGERIDDLKFILSKVSGIATMFDDDGIIVRFMNSDVNGDGIHNATDVAKLISKVRFSGMTPLGTNLDRKVIQPFVLGQAMSNMAKPVLVIIITDGEPSGESHGTIRQVINRAKDALTRTRYGGGALAIQIAQVGKDAKTQKFLESLDRDPVVGGMIDCTSYYELEEEEFARKGVSLTPELWLLKMCVGAIDPEYDSKDD